MSLDFYLTTPAIPASPKCPCCGRFEEAKEGEEIFSANITHNLGAMAREAGIYDALWHPENIPATKASELVPILEKGLALLKSDQPRFERFNASNGWGLYVHFLPFVDKVLDACKANPDANVRTCT